MKCVFGNSVQEMILHYRVTNNIRVKKTRPEKREGGASSASSEPISNPYAVNPNPANPYEVKPNPANPYEVKKRMQKKKRQK